MRQFIIKNIILLIIWFFLLGLIIYSFFKNIFIKYKLINNHKAIYLINKHKGMVFDLRKKSDYDNGHIINAIYINAINILNDNISNLCKHKKYPIILVIENNSLGIKVANKLSNMNFNEIYILKNGMMSWYHEKLPIVNNS
ncbi:rhodanese-like domain-containing protein [Enterobacteriaceae endosymbiont of Donacia tomentosa]|uniref:rhodanese-like domain-containing protein n=1 Tax=Enterobacteriaceae endosymbiont of Donacia tomentosa TaxID=2675787 RepID=UPI0014499617|nr:rhodanese-like domain-containing protein [Enterobacteriaceae endosymbiont of Donacia tomentosa]QJC31678.1 rhodanese-like domain-containing protein [Enterobacteriaceae endosymbiont of Donacia tomentosa]